MLGPDDRTAGKYDYDGGCAPCLGGTYKGQETFSIGIFRWLPKASGKGLKRGKVVYRIRGKVSDAEKVYSRAQEICRSIDESPDWLKNQSKRSEIVK